jgi:hypothetical protein
VEVAEGAADETTIADTRVSRAIHAGSDCSNHGRRSGPGCQTEIIQTLGDELCLECRSTFTKRQKEQTRQQRQREKAERRSQRKQKPVYSECQPRLKMPRD